LADESALRSDHLTWAALLARWVEFAQASLAIPEGSEGSRWRASVAAIIETQAVTMALAQIGDLDRAERALARDRAEILLTRSAAAIGRAWRGTVMSAELLALLEDGRRALRRSAWAGARCFVLAARGSRTVPSLSSEGGGEGEGDLYAMREGTVAQGGQVIAWWIDRAPPRFAAPLDVEERAIDEPVQIYRQSDGSDVVMPFDGDPVAGQPLLERVTAVTGG